MAQVDIGGNRNVSTHDSIRQVDYGGEKWISLTDMTNLVEASRDRWHCEGYPERAMTMDQLARTMQSILG